MTATAIRPATRLRAAVRFATRDLPPAAARVEGVTLTLYRTAAGVKAIDVARALDVSKQYVASLEDEGATVETAGRFRAAVDHLAGITDRLAVEA